MLLSSGADLNPKLRACGQQLELPTQVGPPGRLPGGIGWSSQLLEALEVVPSGSAGSVSTGSSRRTCFLPVRPWRRSRGHGSSSRRRRSCCAGSSGLTPPLPSLASVTPTEVSFLAT